MRQLDDAVREFEAACAQEPISIALSYFDQYALEVWFGSVPNRLRGTLGNLMARGAPENSIAGAVYAFLLGDPLPTTLRGTRIADAVLPEAEPFARMFEHRLRGRTAEATAAGAEIMARRLHMHPVFDRRGGWNLFLSVQLGTTAMLAGDMPQALLHFAEARMHPPAPVLRFLVREACAKAALLEACDGDPGLARQYLTEAQVIERSTSWSEPGVDAIIAVVEAMLDPDLEAAERFMASVQLGQVGEMWPFYAIARNRVLADRGAYAESERLLELLDGMSFPRTPGVGYPGSIVSLLRASLLLGLDNPRGAEPYLDAADPELPRTHLMQAVLSLNMGQPRRALQLMLDMPEHGRELRQVALWRHGVLAAAHLRLDQHDECRNVLERALRLPGRFTARDAREFDDAVREFAATEVTGWPEVFAPAGPFARATAVTGRHLTEREIEVLALLASGRTREEIAATQFISLNTLKTQLRSVYRKLEVSQRSAAVLEAQRRGLI
ncbi:helix-turn-helix transcriptional regulator [Leucobacter luti]|uniref:helix-turn-helix transcriptional regulator n=1 Tax=Leucobacter luti TaxID=340320 RepID=UPI00102AF8FA|nr:LuxR C-terminal-related transcriptional regulator [Leucobacter luti]